MSDFRWLNKQGVESVSGFVVQFTGRFTAEYQEGGRTLVVEVEDGVVGSRPAIIYSRSVFNGWSTSPAEQQRVADNFRAAMLFQGLVPIAD